jgi:hypothetical protein
VDEEGRPVAAVRYHTARDMILLALSLAFFLRSCASMTVPKKMPRQVLAVRHGQSVGVALPIDCAEGENRPVLLGHPGAVVLSQI